MVVNLLMGLLDNEKYYSPYLVQCSFLNKCDSSVIARIVNQTLHSMWPTFDPNRLKVMLSDAAPYMTKAGHDLKVFFPSMVHMTCLAHALHRICETVREMYDDVNDFIASVKAIFKKAPRRIAFYHEKCRLPLPPNPIITRWGTWLEAVSFYANHFEEIKHVIEALDPSEALSIKKAKTLVFRNFEI